MIQSDPLLRSSAAGRCILVSLSLFIFTPYHARKCDSENFRSCGRENFPWPHRTQFLSSNNKRHDPSSALEGLFTNCTLQAPTARSYRAELPQKGITKYNPKARLLRGNFVTLSDSSCLRRKYSLSIHMKATRVSRRWRQPYFGNMQNLHSILGW